MSHDYIPIACDVHDEIENAIMRRAPVELCWTSPEAQQQRAKVVFLEVQTRSGEEYLIFRAGKNVAEVRLDRIVEFSR